MKKEVLRFEKVIYKEDGHIILEGLNIHMFAGEVLELIYMDNLLKKAVVELLMSNLPIWYGRIYLYDKLVNTHGYSACRYNKIAVMQQKRNLIENMSVAENVFVIRGGFRKHIVNRKMLEKQFDKFMEREKIPLNIRGYMQVGDLSAYESAVLELLKAIIMDVKLIVLCDVENYLGERETARFFQTISKFARKGFSFLYLCNKYEKIMDGHVQIVLLEDGKISKLFHNESAEKYFNVLNSGEANKYCQTISNRETLLSFQNISFGTIKNLNFNLRRGECLVFQDMDNLIIEDMIQLMNGDVKQNEVLGKITYRGKDYLERRNKNAVRNGIVFIPEDPTVTNLYHEISFIDNFCFLLDEKKAIKIIKKRIRKNIMQEYYDVFGDVLEEQNMGCVGREDLYKLIYYRVHLCNPAIVFCIRPFSGADMGTRRLILALIEKLKEKGITVVLMLNSISDMTISADKTIHVKNSTLHS